MTVNSKETSDENEAVTTEELKEGEEETIKGGTNGKNV